MRGLPTAPGISMNGADEAYVEATFLRGDQGRRERNPASGLLKAGPGKTNQDIHTA